jgi:DNA (cytosine-5)-methyltransferase 1
MINLDRVPLVRTIRGTNAENYPEGGSPSKRSPSKNKPAQRGTTKKRLANQEKDVLQHRNLTVVTPRVGRIAQRLFEQTLKVAGNLPIEDDAVEDGLTRAIDEARAHHLNPLSMKWLENSNHKGYYKSVVMDGVVYTVSRTTILGFQY